MKKLLALLFLASSLGADTIIGGSSTYDQTLGPNDLFNSETTFNLTLSGGQFTNISVSHFYQQGAKGDYDGDFLTGFNIQPVPSYEIDIIGISTDFSFTLNGVTYYQNLYGSNLPSDGGTYSAAIDLTPISGTNVLNTAQNSTASGEFSLTGDVSAVINGVTYTDTFSGFAAFSGSYMTTGGYPQMPTPQLQESYVFGATAPEPLSCLLTAAGLAILVLYRLTARDC